MAHLWLRSETKAFERRTPLSVQAAERILESGHRLTVESFEDRIFPLSSYKEVGCNITFDHWSKAPKDAIILGLKELADENFSLTHNHIHFAHVFKGQEGFKRTLTRFKEGGGTLYDLEYLVDDKKRRVCAFGYWAGYVGAAVGLKKLLLKKLGLVSDFKIQSYEDKAKYLMELFKLREMYQESIDAIVIGANGRCGRGAMDLFKELDINIIKWDKRETRKVGPYESLKNVDIFVNCALITKKIPPFYVKEFISKQRLSVISDVSCDPTSDLNPLPVYNNITTWEKPFINIGSDIDLLAVDNLPSILPKESSLDFSNQLINHLIEFLNDRNYSVFTAAKNVFDSALQNM